MTNKVEKLRSFENRWETAMGAWFPGERVVFRGKDVFSELSDLSFSQMIFFSISGKIYDGNVLAFMDSMTTMCSSYPDPRLWNNRVAALAGTTRSTAALAVAAGTAVTEANNYGGRAMKRASDLLHRSLVKFNSGFSIEDIVEEELSRFRSLPGFGRPLIRVDERIEPMLEKAKKLSLDQGEYLELVFSIADYLKQKRRRLNLNVNGLLAAIMADQKVLPDDYNQFFVLAFSAGMTACYKDAVNHEEGAFFPFSVNKINYQGELQRSW